MCFTCEKAPGESSNTPSSGKAREEVDTTFDDDDDDVEIDVFYGSLDVAGTPMLSNSHEKLVINTPSDEEIRQALRSVQRFLSHDASVLLDPELCSILKANLNYLSKLSADHGSISREMSKVILEVSQFLTHWSRAALKHISKRHDHVYWDWSSMAPAQTSSTGNVKGNRVAMTN
ncbi:hypothetical protein PIB30_026861 [Stylosanthes scabra]|uniref:Uncharacterized protein n=1 Tax=Stylosanthes scabra TaxID=79078 RepID=A0ABU6SAC8_9FABA|nr:hypothetical protein [Stylosanthes scabra]